MLGTFKEIYFLFNTVLAFKDMGILLEFIVSPHSEFDASLKLSKIKPSDISIQEETL